MHCVLTITMIYRAEFLLAALLLTLSACAQQAAPSRPMTAEASPRVIASICGGGPTRAVRVLRNSAGAVGGYVAVPSIMDAPIAYHDANGQNLAVFHIFDSDAGKAAASAAIEGLRAAFPREEIVPCANLRRQGT